MSKSEQRRRRESKGREVEARSDAAEEDEFID
jgi:hypothetical protein